MNVFFSRRLILYIYIVCSCPSAVGSLIYYFQMFCVCVCVCVCLCVFVCDFICLVLPEETPFEDLRLLSTPHTQHTLLTLNTHSSHSTHTQSPGHDPPHT